MKKFIAIAGNMGAGKTSMVTFLQQTYGFEPIYEPFMDNPYLDEIHWSSSSDIVGHKGSPIRRTLEYRPSLYALQVHPFLFINFPEGTYLLSARRYPYSITYTQSNYVANDQDGIWPNYMVDCARSS